LIALSLPDAAARAAPIERTLLLHGGGHFVGEFNADFRPHGEGTEYRADGSEAASGQWRDGKQHGRGKQTLPSGARYEGDFVAGQMSGLGLFTWPAGAVYEGEFAAGDFNGFGIHWTAEGEVKQCGRWVDDQLVESRPVPRSKIPIGARLSAAGPSPASLLRRLRRARIGSPLSDSDSHFPLRLSPLSLCSPIGLVDLPRRRPLLRLVQRR
jgi:hypothetical protein